MDDGPSRTARSEANMNTASANTQVWKLMFAKVPFEEACAAKFCCALPSPRTSFVDPSVLCSNVGGVAECGGLEIR
jgi:hypothetical protein